MEHDAAGTAPALDEVDPGTAEDHAGTADPEDAGATAGPESGLEPLLDPATLPDALKPHWSRMTQAYNKRLEALKGQTKDVDSLREKAAALDRLSTDPVYARQMVQHMAQQLGLSLTPDTAAPRSAAGSARREARTTDVPAHVLEAVEAALGDEPSLAFMAPVVAKAAWAVAQQSVAPLHEERQQQQTRQRQDEYTQLTSQLSASAPGWEAYEDDMHGRLQFLRAAVSGQGPLSHPQYGNVLELLYRWTAGEARATGEAGKRMQRALTNKTTTGAAAPAKGPSTEALIAQAPSAQDKWQIAFQAGLAEAAAQG